MATSTRGLKALALVVILLCSTSLSLISGPPLSSDKLLETPKIANTGIGVVSEVLISSAGVVVNGPSLTVPADESIQSLDLTISAESEIRATGFEWSDWTQSGMNTNDLALEADGSLILGFSGILWNFDKNNDGWTFSNSYSGRSTTACGYNGTTGGSIRTYAGSTYATSPVTNLQGRTSADFHAWVRQGSYTCGEEPDSNENFYFQYRTTSNSWTTFSTWSGAPASNNTGFQVTHSLPQAALHSNTQFRAYQNSGSGTCCDYWYFDDVLIPGGGGMDNLTTRSFGWSNNAHEQIEEGPYPPLYLDADIPYGAFLNWTIIDADTNNPIPGYIARQGTFIDLSGIDWTKHDSLKMRIGFASNNFGDSPRLFGISGGGHIHDTLSGDPAIDGWEMEGCNTWSDTNHQLSCALNGTATSPVWRSSGPLAAYSFDVDTTGNMLYYISIDGAAWQPISSSTNIVEFAKQAHSVQIKLTSNSSSWTISDFDFQMYPSLAPLNPSIDLNNDGVPEWSVHHQSLGTWGWQDVFYSGNRVEIVNHSTFQSSFTNVLIPKNAEHFRVSADNSNGPGLGLQTLALWIGNTMIAQTDNVGYVNHLSLDLNESETTLYTTVIANTAPVLEAGGELYVVARVELVADYGQHILNGLNIPYDASHKVVASALDSLVLSANSARTDSSLAANLPLRVSADSRSVLSITINEITSSDDVDMGAMTWNNGDGPLVPSQLWRTLGIRTQVHTSAPNMLMINLYSDEASGQWIIPLSAGNIVATGDSDVLIFDDEGPNHNNTGSMHDISINFRTAQSFDDQQSLRFESRVILANGVVSMPAIKSWNNPAVENDMVIESVQWYTDEGILQNDRQYLRTIENLTIAVDVGFEGLSDNQHPYPGEFLLEIYRGDTLVKNTTEITGSNWLVETTTPFTSGSVTWEIILTPTAGGDLGEIYHINRTFIIDPLAPVVVGSNIEHYDHRVSSNLQYLSINITDQPVLPANVGLMLWTEWANDLNGNNWPDEGEFIERELNIPPNLNTSFGSYTAFIDDTAGFPGEKVAGYVVGTDFAGHDLISGGSEEIGDHLFMYQLKADGEPVANSDGFNWVGGKKAWLHPGQAYGLNISLTEPNGVSDIKEIEVSLADNIVSDRLTITWDSDSRQCTSFSQHLLIATCQMLDSNGGIPNAFESDLVLFLELVPQWTMPDLGDTYREPFVRLTDRFGNEDIASFPQNRWRFSAEMLIPNSQSLWVENGVVTDDGARVSPGSTLELSGSVFFFKSNEMPQFDCDIEVRLNGVKTTAIASGGQFTASLTAPITSGQHALTWTVDCLPEQGIDRTSQTDSVLWIRVDDVGPEVVEFLSPRPSSILQTGVHEVKVVVSESFGIDSDSVELFWWISSKQTSNEVDSGSINLQLDGDDNSGLRLTFTGVIDISGLSEEYFQDQMVLKMRLDGRDVAGNFFERESNSQAFPAGVWDMIHYVPEFSIDSGGVELSKLDLEVDEFTAVQIHVRNSGLLLGTAELLVEVVSLDGTRETLAKTEIEIDAESVGTSIVDWKPLEPGIQWIEVTLEEQTEESRMVDVKPKTEEAFMSNILGDANPWLIGIVITMLGITALLILTWLRMATVKQGMSDEDWLTEEMFDDEEY